MRIALLLALGGCMSSEPVREGVATIELDSASRGTASYRVVSGSNDRACAHGEHFTPLHGADVRFGPSGGELVQLVERAEGTYTASAPAVYAAAYQFSVDGELFELEAPPLFTSTFKPLSASQAVIELSDVSAPSHAVIRRPDGRNTGHDLVGSPVVIDADFSQRGEYRIDVVRSVESAAGTVEISRQVTLDI